MTYSIQVTMLRLLAEGTDMQAIIDTASALLGNPILIVDMRFRIPYMSRTENPSIDLWEQAKTEGYVSNPVLADLQHAGIIDRLKNSKDPVRQNLPNGYRSIRYPLLNHGQYCGFVGIYDYLKPFDEKDVDSLSYVAMALSAIASGDSNFSVTQDHYYEEELFQLLCCDSAETAELVCRRLKGLRLPEWKLLCLIAADRRSQMPVGRFKELLPPRVPPTAMALYEDRLVVLLDGRAEAFCQKSDNKKALEELCASSGFRLSSSFPYRQNAFTPLAYRQALFCLQNAESESPTGFESVYPSAIRSLCTSVYSTEYFMHPIFRILGIYDEQYGLNYRQTLLVFLSNQGNMKAVSEELGVHYNTIKHRISMIEDICGQSLRGNSQLIYTLQLSMLFL